MRFIFIEGMLGSTPTHHPLQMLGPVLGGSGPQESSSHTPPPAPRGNLAPLALRGASPSAAASGLCERELCRGLRRPGLRPRAAFSSPRRPRGAGAELGGGAEPGAHGSPTSAGFPHPRWRPTSRPRGVRACVRLSVFSLDVSGNFQPGSERVSKTERQRSAPASRGRKRRFRHRSGPATR